MRCERVQLVAEFFPDFAGWLAKAKSRRFLEEAERVLQKSTTTAVEWACRRLLEAPPRASRLPFEVARLAEEYDVRRNARRWQTIAEGQETVGCPQCRDSGFVDIVHPEVVETLRTGGTVVFPYQAVVLCTCPAGDRRAEISAKLKLPRFDPRVHIPLGNRSVQEVLGELRNGWLKEEVPT